MNKYLKNIGQACSKIEDVEVVFVNDSPNIKLEFDEKLVTNFSLRIIENDKNIGIHASRCNGLKNAKGKYVLFLDQDDEITNDALISQYNKIEQGADLVLGNGMYEDKITTSKIFYNKFSQRFAIKKTPYILARNLIISPGQCLIKKDSIPDFWKEHYLESNGADDYLLWLLMFNDNAKIICNYDIVYIHKYTGDNVSLNNEKMYKSQKDLVEILQKNKEYNSRDLIKLQRTIDYKYNYKKKFFKETIKNLDIFIYNVYYKILWKGYVFDKNI